MPSQNQIALAASLIERSFHCEKNVLEEKCEAMSIPIDNRGINSSMYKLFSFDKNLDARTYPKGLFPFFEKIKGAHSVCDYMLWVQQAGQLYILLVELKSGEQSGGPQLRASHSFANFVVEIFNRVYKKNVAPEIRMITIHNADIQKKGRVRTKPVEYNADGFAEFKGNTFCIQEFLK